ncbi:MAG: Do family serine endopeptidase [Alphaproteobacteria bacterium]|nr:Do family serine endopeptidase [Alphaproteobacteria bacterium]
MKKHILHITAILVCSFTPLGLAQAKDVPQSRAEISLSFAPLVKEISPAVVNIYTKRMVTRRVHPFMNDPFFNQFFGRGLGGLERQRVEGALGSGVIVEKDGLVVSNAHVINGADEITVVLNDGREFPAKVLLSDKNADIALLKIKPDKDGLPYAKLEASENMEVGDLVLAIGNPFGVGQTVTSGIVSALARSSLNINDFNFFIQTDAAINPGNSGGPLVSMRGGVVGINTAIYSRDGGSLGIGFSVPSEMVMAIISAHKNNQVSESGHIKRPWMGLAAQDVTAGIAEGLGLDRPSGALITEIHDASPARAAGLERGDLVVAVNGKKIRDASELRFRIATTPIDDHVRMTVSRKGKEKEIKFKSIAPPEIPTRDTVTIDNNGYFAGFSFSNINPALREELGNDIPEKGVVISAIGKNAQASRFIRIGDVVEEINGIKIETPKDVLKGLKTNFKGYRLAMTLNRNGQRQQIALR